MFIGIDIGGTGIKFGVVNEKGEILKKESIPTKKTTEDIIEDLVSVCSKLIKEYNVTRIGAASPGIVTNGVIQAPGNLPFRYTPLVKILEERLNLPVTLANDAHCAALAEATVGAGKGTQSMIMLTLGTGVGGAIVIDGKIYKGHGGGAGEFGHGIFQRDGIPCPCGRKGCFEQYASITALINQTKNATKQNPNSVLAKICEETKTINGKTVFEALDQNCPVAKKVYDQYVSYLAEGIDSFTLLLQPEVVVLGGAISQQGDRLIAPLQEKLGDVVTVKAASLGGDAGIIGAVLNK